MIQTATVSEHILKAAKRFHENWYFDQTVWVVHPNLYYEYPPRARKTQIPAEWCAVNLIDETYISVDMNYYFTDYVAAIAFYLRWVK